MKKTTLAAGTFAALITGIYTSTAFADTPIVIGGGIQNAIVVPGNSCSPGNPCGTFAVINPNNEVTNTIVCQSAVCGTGVFGGNKVVLQGPTDPNGSGWNGPGYFAGNNSPDPVTYDPNTKIFSVPMGPKSNYSTDQSTGDELSATVSQTISTFQAPSSLTSPIPILSKPKASKNAKAKLSVLQNKENGFTSSQSQTFNPGTTYDQMIATINNNLQATLLSMHEDDLLSLLRSLGY